MDERQKGVGFSKNFLILIAIILLVGVGFIFYLKINEKTPAINSVVVSNINVVGHKIPILSPAQKLELLRSIPATVLLSKKQKLAIISKLIPEVARLTPAEKLNLLREAP
jgi:hypothetical protein